MFDRQLNLLPLPTPDHRACRQLLNSSNRGMWQAMCDHIESVVVSEGAGSLPAKWHRRDGFIRELKETWEPIEDFMADYDVDFLLEVVKLHAQTPPALPVTRKAGRRSRAKSQRSGAAPDELAAARNLTCLGVRAHWLEDVPELPSDVEDRWW